jgi:hypothetical protein
MYVALYHSIVFFIPSFTSVCAGNYNLRQSGPDFTDSSCGLFSIRILHFGVKKFDRIALISQVRREQSPL